MCKTYTVGIKRTNREIKEELHKGKDILYPQTGKFNTVKNNSLQIDIQSQPNVNKKYQCEYDVYRK